MVVKSYLLLFRSELFFALKNYVRYPLNSLVSIALLSLIFLTIYYSSSSLNSSGQSAPLNLRVGLSTFFAWTLVITSFGSVAASIEEHARLGTLEQVVVSGCRYEIVATVKAFISTGIALINNVIILLLLSIWIDISIPFTAAAIVPILFLAISSIGVGLAIGSVAILTKQSRVVTNMLQFVLLPIFFVQSTDSSNLDPIMVWLIPAILPLKSLLLSTNENSGSILLLPSLIVSLMWIVLGYVLIYFAVRLAKRKGLLYQT